MTTLKIMIIASSENKPIIVIRPFQDPPILSPEDASSDRILVARVWSGRGEKDGFIPVFYSEIRRLQMRTSRVWRAGFKESLWAGCRMADAGCRIADFGCRIAVSAWPFDRIEPFTRGRRRPGKRDRRQLQEFRLHQEGLHVHRHWRPLPLSLRPAPSAHYHDSVEVRRGDLCVMAF